MDPTKDTTEKDIPLKQIRTYQGDVADALEKQHESLVSIQRVESLRKDSSRSNNQSNTTEKKKELFYLLLGSFIFLILSAVGAWYAYNEFVRKTTAPPISIPLNRFIYADSVVNLNTTNIPRDNFIKTLSENVLNTPDGKLTHIELKKTTGIEETLLTSEDFLTQLGTQAPGNLVRALDPLFMFGAYGKSAFIIIRLTSFENAFAGMLGWEKNLNRDLGPVFATAELARSLPLESVFTDLIDRNKDIRVLMFNDQIILLYSFLDNNTLIITDNIGTLRTLIEHLTQQKLSR